MVNYLKFNFIILWIWVSIQQIYLCTTCVQCPGRPSHGSWCPGSGVTDRRHPLHVCWELILGPLEEQPPVLISEPSLQSNIKNIYSLCLIKIWHPEFIKNSYETIKRSSLNMSIRVGCGGANVIGRDKKIAMSSREKTCLKKIQITIQK